ncbi:hypothetical protein AB0D34_02405 [Streptomyces sp. NPDC048420]|uniref:hypothetical protein n=1 Tax=Streptomyces sp. NPDC048420 TaxID=3155755 RepID=UPI00342D019F
MTDSDPQGGSQGDRSGIEDTEDAYPVELEWPGVGKDQITVEVAGQKEHSGAVRRQNRHTG